jgi:hypothetical protein
MRIIVLLCHAHVFCMHAESGGQNFEDQNLDTANVSQAQSLSSILRQFPVPDHSKAQKFDWESEIYTSTQILTLQEQTPRNLDTLEFPVYVRQITREQVINPLTYKEENHYPISRKFNSIEKLKEWLLVSLAEVQNKHKLYFALYSEVEICHYMRLLDPRIPIQSFHVVSILGGRQLALDQVDSNQFILVYSGKKDEIKSETAFPFPFPVTRVIIGNGNDNWVLITGEDGSKQLPSQYPFGSIYTANTLNIELKMITL